MHFGNPEFFIAFLLIPVILGIFFIAKKKKKRILEKFVSPNMQRVLITNKSAVARILKNTLLLVVISLLIIAGARPQWGKKLQIIEEKALNIVVAIDVSKSMLVQDLKPNRIKRAKNAFQSFLNKLQGDRVGLVIFSGDSFIQCPLTTDYSALRNVCFSDRCWNNSQRRYKYFFSN